MPEVKIEQKPALVRALGLFTATLLVAGMMIGSGAFKKIIPMAQTGLTESWILIAWALAGFITLLGAFNIIGLASLTEESGGVYEYLRLAFGNFFSFLFGWTDFTILGTASIAALAYIFAHTVNMLIPLPNPLQHLAHISFAHFIYPFADSGIKILAILIIILLTWLNYRGVRESGTINNIVTSAKIIGILLVIFLGLFYPSTAQPQQQEIITSSIPPLHGTSFLSAFFAAMLSVLWAYDGWVNVSFVTGEVQNPKRNVPRAIIVGVTIATVLYVLLNFVYMKVLSLDELAAVNKNEIGAAVVAKTLLGNIGKTIIIILIMVSVFGALNATILTHSRIFFRMAQEKYFFKSLAKVHVRNKTPHIALLYTMVWSCFLVISGTFDILTDMVIFSAFLFYGLLAFAFIKMKQKGMISRKVFGYPVIQGIIILFSVTLIINTIVSQPLQSLIGLGLMFTGVPFYFYFKKKIKIGVPS